jgi:hypothetical protein
MVGEDEKRAWKAVLAGLLWFKKGHRPLLAALLFVAVFVAWALMNPSPPPPPETPQQLQADKAAADLYAKGLAAQAAAAAAQAEREKELCHLSGECMRYGQARQDCAVAGDFNNCISVKMGSTDVDFASQCTADGKIVDAPDDLPSQLRCIWVRANSLLR